MVYLKDEATGVTVEDSGGSAQTYTLTVHLPWRPVQMWSDAEAASLLRGLLRWKLETMGQEKTSELVHATIRDWMHHGVVRGDQ